MTGVESSQVFYKNGKLFFLLRFSLLIIFLLTSPYAHAEFSKDKQVVRVGIVKENGYAQIDENGIAHGFDAEYAYKIAQYAGLTLSFTNENDYTTMLNDLKKGTIDMALGVAKTPEREKDFLYADTETANGIMRVCVRIDDDRFSYGNSNQFKDKKFCAIKDSAMIKAFRTWSNKQGLHPNITEFVTKDEMFAALENGKMDAVLLGGIQPAGYKTVIRFNPTSYYMIFNKNCSEIKNIVDDAMYEITSNDHGYVERLYNSYITTSLSNTVAFTKAEKNYIDTHTPIKVGVLHNDQPFYSEDANGIHKGIIPDYYALLSRLIGCTFQFVAFDSAAEEKATLREGGIDVIGFTMDDTYYAQHQHFIQTRYYTQQTMVQVARTRTRSINTVVVRTCDESTIRSYVLRAGQKLISYDTNETTFKALTSGEADAVICGIADSTWFMNQHRNAEYTVTNIGSLDWRICGAVNSDNTLLVSILSKAASALDSELDGIIAKDTIPDENIRTMIDRMPISMLLILFSIMFIFLVLLALLVYLNWHQKMKLTVIQAETKALAADNAKEAETAFLSSMSHDMRTPLNGIIGFTKLALETDDDEKRKAYLEKISGSSQIMSDIVNDVLDLSKIESGKITLEKSTFDITELLSNVLENIKQLATAKNIELEVENNSQFKFIIADRVRLQQVLINLLSNAVKYNKANGHVSFKIEKINPDKKNYNCRITIADNGIGMSEDFISVMYEPFTQEKREESRHIQGTGLGLTIVKEIVDLMGGTITVHSAINKGTEFVLNFFLVETDEPSSTNESISNKNAINPSILIGKRVLLVEDNEINSEIATAFLVDKQMKVETAVNGQEGLEKISTSSPSYFDFILMDIRMPIMDGYEATKRIRQLNRYDASVIPIIALTANAFSDDIKKALDSGMNGHVSKPINQDELIRTMATILTTQQSIQ